MMENKKNLRNYILIIIIVSIFLNLYYFLNENYVKVYDNKLLADGYEEILCVDYFELLTQENSLSGQVMAYLIDESYSDVSDSKTYEKIGALGILFGTTVLAIGAFMVYKKKDARIACFGAVISCVSIFVLKFVVVSIEDAIQESIIGTLSMFVGGSIIFKTTADTWMIMSLVCCGMLLILTYLFHKKEEIEPSVNQLVANDATAQETVNTDTNNYDISKSESEERTYVI